MTQQIRTLLIANRGEIVVRVARTARELGIRTVAVYSDADRDAPHVRACDDAVHLGPTPASESYLDVAKVVAAALAAGADAVHPGYGFLSERADLPRACAEAGLVFVGPSAEVMDVMGRKDRARDVAVEAGVPVVPAYDVGGAVGSPGGGSGGSPGLVTGARAPSSTDIALVTGARALSSTDSALDFPVLVKAAAGGGGKGMRVVARAEDLAEAMAAARREAASSFGDDTLLVERYVARGRHVEVQVLGDQHGHVVHLFERDCSTQRRHQKVLEEAPAPSIGAEVRELLCESAVALAERVGYTGAGTVEFLLDPDRGTDGVYFLEMNTRLQVEHPVTEEVVRVRGERFDLVALQLAVAAGEPLGFGQDDVTVEGHAIEARIYAEDPYAGFLPQAGRASVVRWSPLARNDHALESGQVVGSSYDPMLGKVIAVGTDREAARRRLVDALDQTAILGLTTNTGFVRQLAASDAFRDGEIDTAWLDRHADAIVEVAPPPSEDLAGVVAASTAAFLGRASAPASAFGRSDGWRSAGPAAPFVVPLTGRDGTHRWEVHPDRVVGPESQWEVRVIGAELHRLRLEVDGRSLAAYVDVQDDLAEVAVQGGRVVFERPDDRRAAGVAEVGDGALTAQMPGTVLSVAVEVGDAVEAGAVLAVLEAMKMELAVKAPFTGTLTQVHAVAGRQVSMGAPLFVVEPRDETQEVRA